MAALPALGGAESGGVVKVVMTVLARDEADVIDAHVAFHLHAGVDFVIATDNRSEDGTAEILERYRRAGVLHLIREEDDDMRQAEWVSRMARLAATEFGADWVLNSDADEFWWPRGGTLKQVLATVPARFGIVRGSWRHFLPTTSREPFFAERMVVRLTRPAHPGAKETIYHAHQKVAHRAHQAVEVESGNHDVVAPGLEPIRAWHPIEVLHFSFRSLEQVEAKCRRGWRNHPPELLTLHQVLQYEAHRTGRLSEYFDQFVVTEEKLERGLADGTLAVDTRLRDALRLLRSPDGTFRLPVEGEPGPLAFHRPDVLEDVAFAAEASILVGIDGVVRAEERADALEARLQTLERSPVHRLLRR